MESPDSYLVMKPNFLISKIYDDGMNLIGRYNFDLIVRMHRMNQM